MPRYEIKDPADGTTLLLEGDSPPTELELERIFKIARLPSQEKMAETSARETRKAKLYGAGELAMHSINVPEAIGRLAVSTGGRLAETVSNVGRGQGMEGALKGLSSSPNQQTERGPMGPGEKGLRGIAQTAPVIAGAAALQAQGAPSPLAFGLLVGSESLAEGEDAATAIGRGIVGAAVPASGTLGKEVVAKGLNAAIDTGLLSGKRTLVQKAIEALGAQGAMQVFMAGMDFPQYAAASPEERKKMLKENILSNSAWLLMELPGMIPGRPSQTQSQMPPATRAAVALHAMVNDPQMLEFLQQHADRVARGWGAPVMGELEAKTEQAAAAKAPLTGEALKSLPTGRDLPTPKGAKPPTPSQLPGKVTPLQFPPEGEQDTQAQPAKTGTPPGPEKPLVSDAHMANWAADLDPDMRARYDAMTDAEKGAVRKRVSNNPQPRHMPPNERELAFGKEWEAESNGRGRQEPWQMSDEARARKAEEMYDILDNKNPGDKQAARDWLGAMENGSFAAHKRITDFYREKWAKEAEEAQQKWEGTKKRFQDLFGSKKDTDDLVKKAIADARANGASPEFRAFFVGIDPELVGTTPEKVAAFAKSLGMEWRPAPKVEPGTSKTPKRPQDAPAPVPAVGEQEGSPAPQAGGKAGQGATAPEVEAPKTPPTEDEIEAVKQKVMAGVPLTDRDREIMGQQREAANRRRALPPEEAAKLSEKEFSKWTYSRIAESPQHMDQIEGLSQLLDALVLRNEDPSLIQRVAEALRNSVQLEDPKLILESAHESGNPEMTLSEAEKVAERNRQFNAQSEPHRQKATKVLRDAESSAPPEQSRKPTQSGATPNAEPAANAATDRQQYSALVDRIKAFGPAWAGATVKGDKAEADRLDQQRVADQSAIEAIRNRHGGKPPGEAETAAATEPAQAASADAAQGKEGAASENITLYRAGDASEKGIKKFSSWTPDRETAQAYQDNPGFGGATLRTEQAPKGKVLDANTTNRRGMSDLAQALGFTREEGDTWFDNGWRYPWEESAEVKKALEASGYDWIKYPDDFPEGATTLVSLKDIPEKPSASPPGGEPTTAAAPAEKPSSTTLEEARTPGNAAAREPAGTGEDTAKGEGEQTGELPPGQSPAAMRKRVGQIADRINRIQKSIPVGEMQVPAYLKEEWDALWRERDELGKKIAEAERPAREQADRERGEKNRQKVADESAPDQPVATPAKPAAQTPEQAYDQSIKVWRAASGKFNEARKAYRSKQIGDEQFLAAKKEFDAAQEEFDRAEAAFIAAKNAPAGKPAEQPAPEPPAAPSVEAPQGPGLVGMGGATPSEFGGDSSLVSNMFAVIDADREARGLEPMPPAKGRSWDQDEKIALDRLNKDPDWIPGLIRQVAQNPRPLLSWEQAGMAFTKAKWKAEQNNALRRIAAAFEDGRQEDLASAKVSEALWADKLQEMEDAVGRRGTGTGSEAGRSLQAQKMGVTEDFDLAEAVMRKEGARGGKRLSDREIADLRKQMDEGKANQEAYERRVAELEKEKEAAALRQAMEDARRAADAAKAPSPYILKVAERIGQELHTQADAARKRVRERLSRMNTQVDPTLLSDLAIIGADHIYSVGLDAAKWSARMVEELGDWVKPHLDQVFKASQAKVDEMADKMGGQSKEAAKRKVTQQTPEQAKDGFSQAIKENLEKNEKGKIAYTLQKLARMLYESGITEREAMVDALTEVVQGDSPQMTRQEVARAWSGYGDYRQLSKEQITVALRGMKGELQQIAKLEDMQAGKPPLKSGMARRETTEAERRLVKEVNDAKNRFQIPITDPQTQLQSPLDTLKKAYTTRMADYQERLSKGDFAPRPRREILMDPEATRLKAAVERIRKQYREGLIADRLKNRTRSEKLADWLTKFRRAGVLTSPAVIPKLISAGAQRLASLPIEEAWGGVLGRVPGLRTVASKAPMEGGGANLKAEMRGFGAAFSQGMKDAYNVLKTGHSELDVLYGKAGESYSGESELGSKFLELPGRVHGMIKAPIKRAVFERSVQRLGEFYARQGLDPSDPVVLSRITVDAYKAANRAIFLQDNWVASKVSSWLAEHVDKQTGHATAGGKVWSTAGRIALPITRVPLNIVSEMMQYIGGSASGGGRLLGAALGKGVESLTPEQSDIIMRHLKKGSVGMAVLALGYYNSEVIGGYYQPGKKKDPKAVGFGKIRVYGREIPSWLLHNPLLETLQFGATVRKVAESHLRKKDSQAQGLASGVVAAALGMAEEVPFVRETAEIEKARNPYTRSDWFGEQLKSIAVPAVVQRAAQWTDSEKLRKPKTPWEHVKMGIPGLRQTVMGKTDITHLSAPDAVSVFEKASSEEKKALRAKVLEKIDKNRTLGWREKEEMAKRVKGSAPANQPAK